MAVGRRCERWNFPRVQRHDETRTRTLHTLTSSRPRAAHTASPPPEPSSSSISGPLTIASTSSPSSSCSPPSESLNLELVDLPGVSLGRCVGDGAEGSAEVDTDRRVVGRGDGKYTASRRREGRGGSARGGGAPTECSRGAGGRDSLLNYVASAGPFSPSCSRSGPSEGERSSHEGARRGRGLPSTNSLRMALTSVQAGTSTAATLAALPPPIVQRGLKRPLQDDTNSRNLPGDRTKGKGKGKHVQPTAEPWKSAGEQSSPTQLSP